MNFKEWLKNDNYTQEINSFLMQIRTYVLNKTQSDGDSLFISFPKNYEIFFPEVAPHIYSDYPMMQMAAWTKPEPIIREATGGFGSPGQDKGTRIIKQALNKNLFPPEFTQEEKNKLAKTINFKLRVVSGQIGLLFEIIVFLKLIKEKKLKVSGEKSVSWAEDEIQRLLKEIVSHTGQQHAANWYTIINHHASGLADDIYRKSQKLLKTSPGQVSFTGGVGYSSIIHSMADIIIDRIGFSIKLSTEPRMTMKETTPESLYRILGGSNISFKEESPENILEHIFEQAQTAEPEQIGSLISWLISGQTETGKTAEVWPAYLDYVTGKKTVGYSQGMKKDFIVNRTELIPKKDSKINVRKTQNSVIIKIQKDSIHGTSIEMQLKPPSKRTSEIFFVVRMRNLLSAE